MRRPALVITAVLTLVVSAFAVADDAKRSATRPEDVRLSWDDDDVEFCTRLGEVKAKSGWGGSMGSGMGEESVKATIRKRAAVLGANVVRMEGMSFNFVTAGSGTAYGCSADALQQQQAKSDEISQKASTPITCTAGVDCEVKWARVTLWLQDHSEWKFRNVTDTLITTEGPLETMKPAFEVTKVPAGDGKTYRISMRAFCGSGNCEKAIRKLRANFYEVIIAPTATGNSAIERPGA